MPARWSDRHRDGECDELPSHAPASDYRDLGCENQGHDAPIAGGGQPAAVGLSRRGTFPLATGKSPALKAKIKEQLRQKCGRYLARCGRPDEAGAYWAAMLGDDPDAAQRMLDIVDRRMRRARWDDMRQWKRHAGIAA